MLNTARAAALHSHGCQIFLVKMPRTKSRIKIKIKIKSKIKREIKWGG